MPSPRAAHALAVAAAVCLQGCGVLGGGQVGGDAPPAIATIGGEPVSVASFEAYAAGVLPPAGEEGAEAPTPELMSRLLDQFLEEELLTREAVRTGLAVSEREVTEALQRIQAPQGAERVRVGSLEEDRERVRRALLTRKLKETMILRDLSVSDDEVAAYFQEHREEFRQESRLVLRQILLDDEDEAKNLRAELAAHPDRFEAAAQSRSLAPDGGRPTAYEEADLPPEIVAVLAPLAPGQVSQVVSGAQGQRILMVEERRPAREVTQEEAADRIRVALLQAKGRRAYESFVEALKQKQPIAIREENASFAYVRRPA